VQEKKNGSVVLQVDLKVKNADNQQFLLVLMGNWIQCTPSVGAIINYIGTFDPANNNRAVIDNEKKNMIVVEPGIMVSCTNIADSLYCERKVVLRSRLRSAGDTTTAIVYGSIIHEIFQSCLATNQFKRRFIRPKITALVKTWSEELLLAGLTTEIASEHLESKVSKLCQWGNNFLRPNPLVKVTETRSQTQKLVSIGKIIDIEEELWSATYGIRGFVDATVEACIRTSRDDVDIKRFLVPLEIKTSVNPKNSFTHQAQTTLYTLLLSERYEIDINFGLLVYSDNAATIVVPTIQREVMDLIIKRNQIAMSLNKKDSLPPMIDNERQCRLCEYLEYCVVYKCVENNASISRKAVEKMGATAGILKDYVDLVGKLKKKHIDFFKHWHTILDKEEQGMESHMKELWEMTSVAREKVGRCFSSVQVKELMNQNISTDTTAHYTYKLAPCENRKFDSKSSEMHPGDRIILSDEKGHIFLASGVLLEVSENYIVVKVKKRLPDLLQKQSGFDLNSNQTYNSLLHSYWDQENFDALADATPMLFRVDKNEFAFNLNVARNNLVELLLNRFGSNRLLNVIVDLKPPVFNKLQRNPELKDIPLNADQQAALNKVASGMDYTIVSGMHGTGKSHTIVAIVEYLVTHKRKTVLVTANTHEDIDDLVVRMGSRGFGVLRVGGWSADPAVLAHMPVGAEIRTEADVHAVYMEPPVVATTCLGITHWVFARRLRFDYCIIDEASRISLPTALGPVCYAEKFILVGDDSDFRGVESTDRADIASALKENISLMERLSVHEAFATVRLDTQYRMCDDITELANRVFYDGALRCGSPEVTGRVLGISAENLSNETKWIRRVLANQYVIYYLFFLRATNIYYITRSKVVFLDTDKTSDSLIPRIIDILIDRLKKLGIDETRLAVLFDKRTAARAYAKHRPKSGLEVTSTSKSHGLDRDCVILALDPVDTRSYLNSLQLGCTRARCKLILIGSLVNLLGTPATVMLANTLIGNEWVCEVPAAVLTNNSSDKPCKSGRRLTTRTRPGRSVRQNHALSSIGQITRDILAQHGLGQNETKSRK
jgi:DNA replication ATP-dependent helicase Dna2